MARVRLDTLLTRRGVYESRTRAAASVLAGDVRLGPDGRRADKPGQMVAEDVVVDVVQPPPFVSRGGIKLRNALDGTGLDVGGRKCLDVGASTGGFTDCLLQHGAAHVVALDVAYGELHWKLRQDDRVTVVERTNARAITRDALPYAPDLITIDVSFIGLAKVLPAILDCAAPKFDALALCKPQFEVGRDRIGKGGVVRDAATRRDALASAAAAANQAGAAVMGVVSSGLPGPKGNRESFLHLAEADRSGGLEADALTAAIAEVEP
jgi:23S rRNA (cytidine1920-2'-O)/16S rRNA (cytidine1409-2'-O)-methyltransferase